MNSKALYRIYRPKNFANVVGQRETVNILTKTIKQNTFSHAYIFSGPRGTGKTSIAKIFAKAVNCENSSDGDCCLKCKSCLECEGNAVDIVEIDAASNNGVDEIREIRSSAKLLPTSLKYKIYIVDEVHMLSSSAFNALLKTLEEPPKHVIFILATTEVNKIPLTVLSRCLRFNFKKISDIDMFERLKYILKNENIDLEDQVIKEIIKLSDGGLRDAINMLEQSIMLSKDENSNVINSLYELTGEITEQQIFDVLDSIFNNDISEGLKYINELFISGKDFTKLAEKLLMFIKNIIINNNTHNYLKEQLSNKLDKYSSFVTYDNEQQIITTLLDLIKELKASTSQKFLMEIAYIKLSSLINQCDNNVSETKKVIAVGEPKEKKEILETNFNEIKSIRINNALACASKDLLKEILEKYSKLDELISDNQYNNIVKTLLIGKVVVVGSSCSIVSFNKKALVTLINKNSEIVSSLFKKAFDYAGKIVAVTDEEWVIIKEEYKKNVINGKKYKILEEDKLVTKTELKIIEDEVSKIFGEESIVEK